MKLATFVQGRDNNLNLIRIIAAYAVLISHSFPLALGKGTHDPISQALGMTLGSIAVDIFFVASGFLVTASLLARQSTIEFLWARTLRIFPALFVMLILTVAGLGLFFSTLSPAAYFTDPVTHKYFWKCLTLLNGIKYELPGVFTDNPYGNAVNGSLWTMRFELRLYLIIALLWLVLRAVGTKRVIAFKVTALACALLYGALMFAGHFGFTESNHVFYKLAFMFFTGAAFFIMKDRIILSSHVFIALGLGLLLSAANEDAFFVAYSLGIAYVLFYLAYVPAGVVRAYNNAGDYSYGVYIYAFPIQQIIAKLVPDISVLGMICLSSIFTIALAVLSWHLVEKRALALKDRFFADRPLQQPITHGFDAKK